MDGDESLGLLCLKVSGVLLRLVIEVQHVEEPDALLLFHIVNVKLTKFFQARPGEGRQQRQPERGFTGPALGPVALGIDREG